MVLRKMTQISVHFLDKDCDAIKRYNFVYPKSIKSNIPPYIKYHDVPIIAHTFTISSVINIFNNKHAFKDLAIDHLKSKPLDFTCPCSPFIYNSICHVTNDDFNVINNIPLQYVLANRLSIVILSSLIGRIP